MRNWHVWGGEERGANINSSVFIYYKLRYAHENGCPWDSTTCRKAASRGNLICLKYGKEENN